MNYKGFTLIELMTSLSILAILIVIGLPSFASQVQKNRVRVAAMSLLDAIELSRTNAVSFNKRTTLAKQVSWQNGWEIFIDTNNDGLLSQDEHLIKQQDAITGVRILANKPIKNYVSFIGTGESRNASGNNNGAFQAGTFKVCPAETGPGYALILARGGRVRMSNINASDCIEN